MFTGTGNRYGVKNLKEIEVQHPKQVFCRSIRRLPFAPSVKRSLSALENIINTASSIQLVVNQIRVALIGESQLILQIIETVINRRG